MGPGTSPEKEREMGWLPVQVCSGERVGSLGSLALEPWLVFWRVEGTSRWARRECPGLRARFHRKEWGGGTFRDRGRTVPVSPPWGGAEMDGRL